MCEGCNKTRICRVKPVEFEEAKLDAIRGVVKPMDETTSICQVEGAIRGLEIFQRFLSSPYDHPAIMAEVAERRPDLVFCSNVERVHKPFRRGKYRPDLSRREGTWRTEDNKALH